MHTFTVTVGVDGSSKPRIGRSGTGCGIFQCRLNGNGRVVGVVNVAAGRVDGIGRGLRMQDRGMSDGRDSRFVCKSNRHADEVVHDPGAFTPRKLNPIKK